MPAKKVASQLFNVFSCHRCLWSCLDTPLVVFLFDAYLLCVLRKKWRVMMDLKKLCVFSSSSSYIFFVCCLLERLQIFPFVYTQHTRGLAGHDETWMGKVREEYEKRLQRFRVKWQGNFHMCATTIIVCDKISQLFCEASRFFECGVKWHSWLRSSLAHCLLHMCRSNAVTQNKMIGKTVNSTEFCSGEKEEMQKIIFMALSLFTKSGMVAGAECCGTAQEQESTEWCKKSLNKKQEGKKMKETGLFSRCLSLYFCIFTGQFLCDL